MSDERTWLILGSYPASTVRPSQRKSVSAPLHSSVIIVLNSFRSLLILWATMMRESHRALYCENKLIALSKQLAARARVLMILILYSVIKSNEIDDVIANADLLSRSVRLLCNTGSII
jgi:hypothetical protein